MQDWILEKLKQKPIKLFLVANVGIPIFVSLIIAVFFQPYYEIEYMRNVQRYFAFTVVFIILVLNLVGVYRYKKQRKYFLVIIPLNLLATVMIGDVSFVTGLRQIPFLLQQLSLML